MILSSFQIHMVYAPIIYIKQIIKETIIVQQFKSIYQTLRSENSSYIQSFILEIKIFATSLNVLSP